MVVNVHAKQDIIIVPEEKNFFSERGLARFAGLTRRQVQYDVVKGRIRGTNFGRTRIFTREQAEDYVANDRQTDLTPGRFTLDEAAAYLEMEPGEFRKAIGAGRIEPLELAGEQLFSQDQLDDFAEHGRTDLPADIPFFSSEEAAEYLVRAGVEWKDPISALSQHVYILGNIPAETAGKNLILRREALDRFLDSEHIRSTLDDAQVAEIVRRVDDGEGYSEIARDMNLPRQTVRQTYLREAGEDA